MNQNLLSSKNKLLWLLFALLAPLICIAQPKADFSFSPSRGCTPLIVQFTNKSSGTGTLTYQWRFGTGNQSTLKDPGAVYYVPGSYSVTLVVKDANGVDSITKTNAITVYKSPIAKMSADIGGGCKPLKVNFKDISAPGSAPISSWQWDFGDGSVSNIQNPTHTYVNSGNYNVKLIIKDTNGCSHDITQKDFIKVSEKPVVNFSASDSVACDPPLNVKFTSKITAPAGAKLKYLWEFGDGNTSTAVNPGYTYTSNGNYNVKLTVTDSATCSSSLTKNAYININKAKANFLFTPNNACLPVTVSFSNTSSLPNANFLWNFGNGDTSTSKNPSYYYIKAGVYKVKLYLTTASGCKDSVEKQVTVLEKPIADFSSNDSIFCKLPAVVYFSDKSKNAAKWQWDFSNASYSTQQNPVITYTNSGSYTVQLKVTSADGCSDDTVKTFYIKIDLPKAKHNKDNNTGCRPFTTTFKNLSTSADSIVKYFWEFGDGKTSTLKEPTNTYVNVGKFKVKQTITTSRGCTDSFVSYVQVGDPVPPKFSATPRIKCLDTNSVFFTNLTPTSPLGADSFFWNFGDGATSTETSPRHVYDAKPGKYNITLVSFSSGCADTLVMKEYIELRPPWANFTFKTATCFRDTVLFYDSSVGATSLRWKFPDTTFSTLKNPRKHLPAGTHLVILEAYNNITGCKDTFALKVSVPERFKVSFGAVNPVGCAPMSIKFRDTISLTATREWDFGNGQTSTDTNPTVIYDKPGNYTVKLKATSDEGCVITKVRTAYIKVSGTNVRFTMSPDKGCLPLRIKFTDSSTSNAGIKEREWDFGDGVKIKTATDTISHLYTKPPLQPSAGYGVTLAVTDNNGCRNLLKKTVLPTKPRAHFSATPAPECNKLEYSFKALLADSTGLGPFNITWNFGDGSIINTTNPSYTKVYKNNGTYNVTMTLTDIYGCKDSITQSIAIDKQKPKVKFFATPTQANCPPLTVTFIDSSRSAFATGNIVRWEWDFGDGSKSFLKNPQKIFTQAGNFTVKLKIEDDKGCVDSLSMPNLIRLKGPQGSYSFDKTKGCTPLTVKFTATAQNVIDYTWDLGDGTIAKGPSITHTYTKDTNYIPLLILTDSTNCRVTLPPKDTIKVFPLPVPDFRFDGACFGYPTVFMDSSVTKKGTVKEWFWEFGDGTTSILPMPFHVYKNPGFYFVKHSIKTDLGCTKDTIKKIKIGGLKADFNISDTFGCVGTGIFFTDKTKSDSAIAGWQWSFGDGDSSSLQNPTHIYKTKGIYDVMLRVWDYKGCMDTLLKAKIASIGDTLPPPPPPIYRVTVENDNVIRMDFGMFKEIDFERYNVYRETMPGVFTLIGTIKNAQDTIYYDSTVNTLKKSYCYKIQVRNFCGFSSLLSESETHCSVEITAKPDINKAIISWNHYKGWDSIRRYEIYRQDIKNPLVYNFLNTVPGTVAIYEDTNIICYTTHTYRVKAIEQGGDLQESWSDTSSATPIYVPNVPSNELISATVIDNKNVQVDWGDVPGTKIKYFYLEKSENGNTYTPVGGPFSPNTFTYKDENVDVNRTSYYYRTQIEDSCGDMGLYSNIGKTILLKVDTSFNARPRLKWNPYLDWKEGVRYYDIERKNPDGTFTLIDRTNTGNQLEYIDEITDLNSLPHYCYRVIAHRNGPGFDPDKNMHITSTSNEDCVKVSSTIWVPNVFTPFGTDSLNDLFDIKGTYIVKYKLKIFNRWGEELFESNDLKHKWDGKYKGEKCPMEVYIYQLEATGVDGFFTYKKGFVTILR